MSQTFYIINDPAHDTQCCGNSLRIAMKLVKRDAEENQVFLSGQIRPNGMEAFGIVSKAKE